MPLIGRADERARGIPTRAMMWKVEPAALISRPTGVRSLSLATSLLVVVAISACTSSGSGDSAAPTVQTSAVADASPRPESTARISTALREPGAAAANRALAMAAAARAFRHFPVPPGSTRITRAPDRAPRLRGLHAYIGPVDKTLTRTGWWLVPLRYDRLVAWYVSHTPADRGSAYYADGTGPAPDAQIYWQTRHRSPAFSPPAEVVAYTTLGPHATAIRTDVTLAARVDRTADTLVPATVTSLAITKRAIDGPDTTPKTVTITDRSHILDVVAAFDRASGAYASVEPGPCGSPGGIVYIYAVTFHWPDHTLVVDPGQALCGVGRGLNLDGSQLPQTLEDDAELNNALSAAFDAS
jgi:hypothetical protein